LLGVLFMGLWWLLSERKPAVVLSTTRE
jgi:hypothetical protein